jgi:hypothetical protein
LLVVFQHSNKDPGESQPRAIKGMNELRFGARFGTIPDIGPPRLKITAVAARTDLEPFGAAGSPHLDIICFTGSKTQVPGTQLYHAMSYAQPPTYILSIGYHFLQFFVGTIRVGDPVKLHLIELVPPLYAPGVRAGGHLLPTKTGGIGNITKGQAVGTQYLITVKVGQRHLRRGYKPEVVFFVVI